MEVDVLILGGGLAGCVSAWQWHLRGYSVVVVDQTGHSNSSRVAGGFLNPILGKRFVVDPLFAAQQKEALSFYQQVERELGTTVFNTLPQWRIFQNEEERIQWARRMDQPLVQPWHGPLMDSTDFPEAIMAPLGGFEVRQTGWLNMNRLIQGTREAIPFLESSISDEDVTYRDGVVQFKHITATRAVFCRGYRETYHHFTAPDPQYAKGEILVLSIPDLPTSHSINKGGWLLPIGDGLWKAGATYEWNELNDDPTESGCAQLLERIAKTIRTPVQVVDQMAGVRPSLKCREPVRLAHENAPMFLLNGLGAKGTLQAPYSSRLLMEKILADSSGD